MHAGNDNSPTELIAPTIPAGSPVEALFPDFDSPRGPAGSTTRRERDRW